MSGKRQAGHSEQALVERAIVEKAIVARPVRSRRFYSWLAALLLVATVAGAALIYRGKYLQQPEIPLVNLDGADPELVEMVYLAQRDVRGAPRSAVAWGGLAMVLHGNGFSEAAHRCYAAASQFDPGQPIWPYLQGHLHQHGPGGPEAAWPHFDRSASLGPPHSLAHLRLADTLLELGRFDDAAQAYRGLLEADSGNPHAHLGLGKLAVAERRYQDCLGFLAPIAENPLVQREACAIRASAYESLRNRTAAEGERRRLAELPEDRMRPDDPLIAVRQLEVGAGTQIEAAMGLLDERRFAEALELMQQTVRRYPHSVEAWAALGNVSGLAGNPTEAERAIAKCTVLAPKSAQHWLSLGHVHLWQRRNQEAEKSLRRAIELDPRNGSAFFSLGECLQRLGDSAAAAQAYGEALRLSPNHTLARERLRKLNEDP